MLTLADALRAKARIGPHVRRTPLSPSVWLSDLTGADVHLKLESMQVSNSFKARGAFNAVIARLERRPRPSRLVTASAGNHGRGLAAAARTFGLPLTVFTPSDAPHVKLAAIGRLGADLRAEGTDYDDAERLAKAYAAQGGGEFVSPYNDPDVIAGAATVALEIIEDQPEVDVLVVPVGGGGLISGAAAVAKAIKPRIEVVGVEVEASCPFQTGLKAGHLVPIVPGPSLADGLVGNPDPETTTFGYIRALVDSIVTVNEADLAAAIVGMVEHEHLIAEGAGAAATAALAGGRIEPRGRRVAVVVSGSNIDRGRLASLLAGR